MNKQNVGASDVDDAAKKKRIIDCQKEMGEVLKKHKIKLDVRTRNEIVMVCEEELV